MKKKRVYASLAEYLDRTGTNQRRLIERIREQTGRVISPAMLCSVLRGSRRCSRFNALVIHVVTGVPMETLTKWPRDTNSDNSPEHFFLGTQLDNMRDAAVKGRLHTPRPRRQKLTTEQLADISVLARSGMPQQDIARRFGVSQTFISLYLKGKRRQYDAPRRREQVA